MPRRPAQPLILYAYEGCPSCRRVRLALEALDLPTEVRPCPKGGRRYREEGRGGGAEAARWGRRTPGVEGPRASR